MIEIDFFGSSQPRSIYERVKKIKIFEENKAQNDDFVNYGYDYFDNPDYGVGYGGYQYDGRYKDSVDKMISHYALAPHSSVLELGCAKGFILTEFHKRNMNVSGVDLSEYAVQNAHPDVKQFINQGSCEALGFETDSFDLVYSKEMLPHLSVDQLVPAIKEAQRVCKTNNIFFEIQVGNDSKAQQLVKAWDETHQTSESADWWREKLSSLGFEGQVNFKAIF